MYKYLIIAILIMAAASFGTYKALAQKTPSEKVSAEGKVLIVYYSYSGNTKKVAQAIQDKIGGDMFEIKTEGTYPENYNEMVQQAKEEITNNYRPALTTKLENLAQYDVVFIGTPNWWSTITPQLSSFLQAYDLSGKTVIPFITHGGGGVQNTVSDLTAQCKGCKVSDAPWVGYNDRTMGIADWLKGLGFDVK